MKPLPHFGNLDLGQMSILLFVSLSLLLIKKKWRKRKKSYRRRHGQLFSTRRIDEGLGKFNTRRSERQTLT
jgi:hypothetical protein